MQICKLIAPQESARAVAITAFSGFDSKHDPSARLLQNAPAGALDLAEYLHEDLAQTLCAVKIRLEGLAPSQLRAAHIASSVAALQDAIRQLSSLAAEIRSVSADTRVPLKVAGRIPRATPRARVRGARNTHPSVSPAVAPAAALMT
jgi:hypothetical protein